MCEFGLALGTGSLSAQNGTTAGKYSPVVKSTVCRAKGPESSPALLLTGCVTSGKLAGSLCLSTLICQMEINVDATPYGYFKD